MGKSDVNQPNIITVAILVACATTFACGKASFRDVPQTSSRDEVGDEGRNGQNIQVPDTQTAATGKNGSPPVESKEPLLPGEGGTPGGIGGTPGGGISGTPGGGISGTPGGIGGTPGGIGGTPGGGISGTPGGGIGGTPGGIGGTPGGIGGTPGGGIGGTPGGGIGGTPGGIGGTPGGIGGTPSGNPETAPVEQADTIAGGIDGTLLVCLDFRQGVMSVHNVGVARWFAANFNFTVHTPSGPVVRRWNPAINQGYQLPGNWSKVCDANPVVTKFRPLQAQNRHNPPLWSLPPRLNQGDRRCVLIDDGDSGRPGSVELALDWRLGVCP